MSREELMMRDYAERGAYHRARFSVATIRYDITRKLLPKSLHGLRALDVGGGDGAMASRMADRGAEVTVLDPIHQALQYSKDGDERLRVVQGATHLPFPDKSFDIATMLECLEHIPDEQEAAALSEVHRILKDDGTFVISVPSSKIAVSAFHYRHYSPERLEEVLEDAGFAPDTSVPHYDLSGFYTVPAGRLMMKAAYGADLMYRNLTGGMGLVQTSPERADAFVVACRPVVT